MTAAVTVDPQVSDPEAEEDEPEVAHICRRDDSLRGYVEGVPVEALCGKRFVPSRNPDGMPVCPRCEQMIEQLRSARRGTN